MRSFCVDFSKWFFILRQMSTTKCLRHLFILFGCCFPLIFGWCFCWRLMKLRGNLHAEIIVSIALNRYLNSVPLKRPVHWSQFFLSFVFFSGLVDKFPNQNYLSNAGYKGNYSFCFYLSVLTFDDIEWNKNEIYALANRRITFRMSDGRM